jgi:hypothetical protein
MKHEASTVMLIIILSIMVVFVVVSAITSEDVDEVCSTDGTFLYRNMGSWGCGNITVNNSFNDEFENLSVNDIINLGKYINLSDPQDGTDKSQDLRGLVYDTGTEIIQFGIDNLYPSYYTQRAINKACLLANGLNVWDSNFCDITNIYQGDSSEDPNLYLNYVVSTLFNASIIMGYGAEWDINKYSNFGLPHGIIVGGGGVTEAIPLIFTAKSEGPQREGAYMRYDNNNHELDISGDNQPLFQRDRNVGLSIENFSGGFKVDDISVPFESTDSNSRYLCVDISDGHLFINETGCS